MTVAACPSSAQAAKLAAPILAQAKKMADEAAGHFHKKRYKQAAELFEQSYALDPSHLVRLRNAGRAYEEAGLDRRALHCFKRYAERATDPKLKVDADERIARLGAAVEKAEQAQQADEGSKPSAVAAPVVEVAKKPQIQPSRTKPWLVTGGGVALLAGGGALLAMTLGAEADIEAGAADGLYTDSKLQADRDTVGVNKKLAYGVMGFGAVAAGVGVWLLVRKPAQAAALAPMIGGGRLGLLATTRF